MENLNSDVSVEGVEAFFSERDPGLADAIKGMESVETWTRDKEQQVHETLQNLANRIEDFDMHKLEDSTQSKLIILLSYISSGKAIKLLMWIEHNNPNFVARTLADAQMISALDRFNHGAARLFVERFEVLERMHNLSRIFSEDRLEIVQRVLRILAGEENYQDSNSEDQEEASL